MTTTSSTMKTAPKQLYLLTDPGFSQRLLQNLLCMTSLLVCVSSVPSLNQHAQQFYWQLNEYALSAAHRYAWWSLLALLSSSCCALQLILNSMSLGCAGFNTVLGPLRPTLLAISLLVQAGSWYVAWERPWQWAPTALSTVLMVSLSLLPEALQFYEQRKFKTTQNTATTTQATTQTLQLAMNSVGCAACMVTVSGVLDSIPQVMEYQASLETNRLVVQCSQGYNSSELLRKLEDVGFPMELVEDSSSKKKQQ